MIPGFWSPVELNVLILPSLSGLSADISQLTGSDLKLRCRSSALQILKLKEKKHVSQVAIDDIVESSMAQYDNCVEMMTATIRSQPADKGLDPDDFDFSTPLQLMGHPFTGLETQYKQVKYFKEELNLIVSFCVTVYKHYNFNISGAS